MFVAALLMLVPLPLLAFLMYDRLVAYLQSCHEPEWRREGRPHGLFRLYPGGSYAARSSACYRWLFRTPRWVARSAHAAAWLKVMRVCVALWCAAATVLFLLGSAGIIR